MKMNFNSQRGLTIIEFTLIAWGLFVLMFFAFEVGRYMFTMQMLNEMTRKAARLAVVCSIEDQYDIRDLAEVKENRPTGFVADNLLIDYVDINGAVVSVAGFSGMDEDAKNLVLSQIKFVKTEISEYQFRFMPLLNFLGDSGAINVPTFRTLLPTESLGIVRPNSGSEYGTIEDC